MYERVLRSCVVRDLLFVCRDQAMLYFERLDARGVPYDVIEYYTFDDGRFVARVEFCTDESFV